MGYFHARGIATRLWLGFGLVLALLLAAAGFSLERLRGYQQQADALVEESIGVLDAIGRMQEAAAAREVLLRDLVLNDNLKVQRAMRAKLQAGARAHAEAAHRLAELAERSKMRGARDAVQGILALDRRIAGLEQSVQRQVDDGLYDDAKASLADTLQPQHEQMHGLLRALFVATMADARDSVERNREASRLVASLVAGITLLALAVGGAVAFLTTRSIVRPLAEAREAALHMAQGDLARPIHSRGSDEIAQLAGALEWMRRSLADAVTEIRSAAQRVSTGALQIERGNGDLSSRTEEQAASLEETASAIEELTATVKQNSEGASQARELARATTGVASRGGEAVRGVVATMQGIHDSSRRIGDIIGVIDGIAFQTNILALNAAVEAARAGEQGRGFAVVAAEVRSLAQRSAEAAREIKRLIQDSAGRVEGGVLQVETTGATMNEVVASVQRVNQLIAEIAAASAEQLVGIEQVNGAIARMDANTQQNAGQVEEAARAAGQMAREAELLVGAVSRFRLHGDPASGEGPDRPVQPLPLPMPGLPVAA